MSDEFKSNTTTIFYEKAPTEARNEEAPMVLRRERRIKELEQQLELCAKREQALERKLTASKLECETANAGWSSCEKKFVAERKARRALSALLIAAKEKA